MPIITNGITIPGVSGSLHQALDGQEVNCNREDGQSGSNKYNLHLVPGSANTNEVVEGVFRHFLNNEADGNVYGSIYPLDWWSLGRAHYMAVTLLASNVTISPRWGNEQRVLKNSAQMGISTFEWYDVNVGYTNYYILNQPRVKINRSVNATAFPENSFTNGFGNPIQTPIIKYEQSVELEFTVYDSDFNDSGLANTYFEEEPPIGKVNQYDEEIGSDELNFAPFFIYGGKLLCIGAEDFREPYYSAIRRVRRYRFLYKTGAEDNIWNKILINDVYTDIHPAPYEEFAFKDIIPPSLLFVPRVFWYNSGGGGVPGVQ